MSTLNTSLDVGYDIIINTGRREGFSVRMRARICKQLQYSD